MTWGFVLPFSQNNDNGRFFKDRHSLDSWALETTTRGIMTLQENYGKLKHTYVGSAVQKLEPWLSASESVKQQTVPKG